MATKLYPKYQEAMRKKSSDAYDLSSGAVVVKAALVDTGAYTFNAAHQFYSSLSGVVGAPVALANKTVGTVSTATFDADNVTFPGVSGNSAEAIVLYVDTGNPATSPLVAYIDAATGLPVTPNGGDIMITWDAAGIFT